MNNNVFLIEDSLAIIDIYGMAFKAAGIHFTAITSGKEAIKKIAGIQDGTEEKPALVLLDLMLPDANGLDILFQIRKHPVTKDIKVFILSNYSSEALLNMSYIKADKYFLKSDITPTQLVKTIEEALKK